MPFLAPIVSAIGSLAGRVVGSHLLRNHAAKLGEGTLQSVVGGLGMRFVLGFLLAGYLFNEQIRGAINGLIGALKHAVIT